MTPPHTVPLGHFVLVRPYFALVRSPCSNPTHPHLARHGDEIEALFDNYESQKDPNLNPDPNPNPNPLTPTLTPTPTPKDRAALLEAELKQAKKANNATSTPFERHFNVVQRYFRPATLLMPRHPPPGRIR